MYLHYFIRENNIIFLSVFFLQTATLLKYSQHNRLGGSTVITKHISISKHNQIQICCSLKHCPIWQRCVRPFTNIFWIDLGPGRSQNTTVWTFGMITVSLKFSSFISDATNYTDCDRTHYLLAIQFKWNFSLLASKQNRLFTARKPVNFRQGCGGRKTRQVTVYIVITFVCYGRFYCLETRAKELHI